MGAWPTLCGNLRVLDIHFMLELQWPFVLPQKQHIAQTHGLYNKVHIAINKQSSRAGSRSSPNNPQK